MQYLEQQSHVSHIIRKSSVRINYMHCRMEYMSSVSQSLAGQVCDIRLPQAPCKVNDSPTRHLLP